MRLPAFDFLSRIFAAESAANAEKNLRIMGDLGLNIVIYLFTWALSFGLMAGLMKSIP